MELAILLVIFLISLAFILVSIIKFNLHPFLALIFGALIMGILAGTPITDVANGIASGFGSTMTSVGILIILGIILGNILHQSGCTGQIAALLLKAVGEKRAAVALNLTGFIVSIPVFFDAAFVILISLVKSLSRKGKIPFISLVCALAVGLITTHCMVIPTPGPVTVVGNMDLNIGWFLLYSLIAALPACLIGGVLYGKWLGKRPQYCEDFANAFEEEEEAEAALEESGSELPSGGLGVGLIILPIAIILLGTILTMFLDEESAAYTFFSFIGNKNIALLIGVVVAFLALRKYLTNPFTEIVTESTTQSGTILAITGAGGAFGATIQATAMADLLVESLSGTAISAGIVIIILAFVISQVLRAAQGSATVALTTTSAIFAPIVVGLSTVSPILVGLAICAGAIGLSLPNDSGFWVVNRFSGYSVKQTMVLWSAAGTVTGVTALVIICILSLFTGVLPGLI